MPTERKYTLVTIGDPYGTASYYTGCGSGGRQVLMGIGSLEPEGEDGVLVLWFGPDGEYQRIEALSLPPGEAEPDGSTLMTIRKFIPRWQQSIGYKPAPIHLDYFELWEPFRIGFRELTAAMEDHFDAAHPGPHGPSSMGASIAKWRAEGNFVFIWGDESFCLNADGSRWD